MRRFGALLAALACCAASGVPRARSAVRIVGAGGRILADQQQQQQQQQRWAPPGLWHPARVAGSLRAARSLGAGDWQALRGGSTPTASRVGGAAAPRKSKPTPKQQLAGSDAEARQLAEAAAADAPRKPHELEIVASASAESSAVSMHPSRLAELEIMEGDTVRLKGKRDRETLAIVGEDSALDPGSVAVSAVGRLNLRLELGEVSKVYRCDNARHATRAVVLPFSDKMGGLTLEEIQEQLVQPYFHGAEGEEPPYRPVREGDVLRLQHGAQVVELKVIETEPARRGIISPETDLSLEEDAEPLDREAEEAGER